MSAICLNVKNPLVPCSETTKTALVMVTTSVALAGIAFTVLGLLAQGQILPGINTLTQWALIGGGSGAVLVGSCVALVSFFSIGKKVEKFLSYAAVQQELEACLKEGKDPFKVVEQLTREIPLEQLQKFVKTQYTDSAEVGESAKAMLSQARAYLNIQRGYSPTLKARLQSLLDSLVAILDSIFLAFGISEFFDLAENKMEGSIKFQKITMLIGFFTLITATLLPMFGVTASTSVVGGLMLAIAVMSLVWSRIRPRPSRLPEGENWSRQVREGELGGVKGREEAVRKIAGALSEKKHPLLIGPSGIGKTQTVQAFVQALENGEFPELKGKEVFYFNTANLVTSRELFGGGNKILRRLSEAIGRHREKCILIFDEIHLAYEVKKSTSAIGEQLKTFLDENANNFPYVIGLTTEEEYTRSIFVANAAGDRRFEKVTIESMEDAGTERILNEFLIQKAPGVLVEEGAIAHLVSETKESPQPYTAKKILSQCLSKLSHEVPKLKEVEEARNTLLKAQTEGALLGSGALAKEKEKGEEIVRLEQELEELESELQQEGAKLRQLLGTKTHLAKAREAKFRAAIAASKSNRERVKSRFLLLKYFLEGALEGHIRYETEFKSEVTKELIDEALREEAENGEKRKEAIARAKEEAEQRR